MTKDSSLSTRHSPYRAPSWSWASVQGEVDWPTRTIARHCHHNFTIELLESRIQTTTNNDKGSVTTGAWLILDGKLQQIARVVRHDEWGALLRFPFDIIATDGSTISNGLFDVDTEVMEEGIWMLQIEMQGDGDSFFPNHASCLLLKRPHHGEDSFTRVGGICGVE